MKSNKDGFAKNMEVCAEQWTDYQEELDEIVYPGIAEARGFSEIVHKTSAIGEEFHDKCPRIAWYLMVVRWVVIYPALLGTIGYLL